MFSGDEIWKRALPLYEQAGNEATPLYIIQKRGDETKEIRWATELSYEHIKDACEFAKVICSAAEKEGRAAYGKIEHRIPKTDSHIEDFKKELLAMKADREKRMENIFRQLYDAAKSTPWAFLDTVLPETKIPSSFANPLSGICRYLEDAFCFTVSSPEKEEKYMLSVNSSRPPHRPDSRRGESRMHPYPQKRPLHEHPYARRVYRRD